MRCDARASLRRLAAAIRGRVHHETRHAQGGDSDRSRCGGEGCRAIPGLELVWGWDPSNRTPPRSAPSEMPAASRRNCGAGASTRTDWRHTMEETKRTTSEQKRGEGARGAKGRRPRPALWHARMHKPQQSDSDLRTQRIAIETHSTIDWGSGVVTALKFRAWQLAEVGKPQRGWPWPLGPGGSVPCDAGSGSEQVERVGGHSRGRRLKMDE